MQKIVYRITKNVKEKPFIKGIGYIINNNIIVSTNDNDKQKVIVFEDATKDCHPNGNRINEFKGCYKWLTSCNNFEGCREVDYNIWYKIIG